jgi:glycosyltransferase involved in cell wall biosynthesis
MEHRAVIPAVPDGRRPLWSVMIPAHDCAGYLARTIQSVLDQDPGGDVMQIEVVDDCSSDDPQQVVEEVGRGRVAYHRQPENVGQIRNFETCLLRARGELVHLLHGDDAVRPGFYASLGPPLVANPDLGAAFCRYEAIDEADRVVAVADVEQPEPGVLHDWLERIAVGQRLQTPCMVVRRSVYERLGGFDRRIRHAEDWEMWVRIAAHYPVWYEPQVLAQYRIHRRSGSAGDLRTGANVAGLRTAIAINREVLPAAAADRLTARALETTATTALRRAARAAGVGELRTAAAQTREAFRTSSRPRVWLHAAYQLGRAARGMAAHAARRSLRDPARVPRA